jgi:hypothetical protein
MSSHPAGTAPSRTIVLSGSEGATGTEFLPRILSP